MRRRLRLRSPVTRVTTATRLFLLTMSASALAPSVAEGKEQTTTSRDRLLQLCAE
mgnify:FL=1